ncbi:MAG: ATP-binding protein [Marinilabiliales bacterium]|nr:MAG: ATP-binding protein [Marinilabiliales bacterium]
MKEYIQDLISEGEHQQQDFKYCITDSKKIAKSLVAFANTEGGRLLIGVKDNGKIAGVRSEEEFYMVEGAADLYCKPVVKFETKSWNVNGKVVLEVIVEESSNKPHMAKDRSGVWMAYRRVQDQNILVNKVQLEVWKRQNEKIPVKIEYSEREKILLNHLKNNEVISLMRFCKLAMIPEKEAEEILISFVQLNILEIIFTEQNVLYKLVNEDVLNEI